MSWKQWLLVCRNSLPHLVTISFSTDDNGAENRLIQQLLVHEKTHPADLQSNETNRKKTAKVHP